jgi:hypothetical protein
VPLHTDPVPEDRATGERRRRIDGDHTNTLPGRPVVRDHRVDDGRLTGARVTCDADDVCLAGVREDRLERGERLGPAVIDVTHEARARTNLTGEDGLDVDVDRHGFLNRCSGPGGV